MAAEEVAPHRRAIPVTHNDVGVKLGLTFEFREIADQG
jgi:hypothetical protein